MKIDEDVKNKMLDLMAEDIKARNPYYSLFPTWLIISIYMLRAEKELNKEKE